MREKIKIILNKIWSLVKYKADFPIHPFILALFPVLFLYSHNIREVLLKSTFLPTVIILFGTTLLIIILYLIFRNLKKVATENSFLILLFFSYGHVINLSSEFNFEIFGFNIFQDNVIFYLWIVIALLGSFFILRTTKNFNTATIILNVLALLLIISPLITIVYSGLITNKVSFSQKIVTREFEEGLKEADNPKLKPDIYYIILDRYAHNDVLQSVFGFDNSKFTNFLESKGFYLAQKSFANYPKTFQSLASSLNMSYLDFLTKEYKDSKDWTIAYPYMYDYEVWRFLKNQGYEFIHFGDWWDPTRINKFADRNINYYGTGITDEFANKLLETTFIYPFIKPEGTWYERVRAGHLYKFDQLNKISKEKGPKFVFAHVILPHEPFVFGKNCEPQNEKIKLGSKKEKEAYINQLICTNKKITSFVDNIIENSDPKPIIILQSDEGPFTEEFQGGVGGNIDWQKLSTNALKDHLQIMNAYFLPESTKGILYPSITPVNSFRVIFNEYFNTNLKLLPDKSYIIPDLDHPYIFIDVTDKLRSD